VLLWLVVLVLSPLFLAGCSSGAGLSVSGKATLDDKPLDGATLEFAPIDSKERIGNERVVTDSQGNFTITPDKKKFGLRPGKFGVRVSKWVDKKTGKPPDNPDDIEQLRLSGLGVNSVPFKYSDPVTNPVITVDLKAGKNTDVKIELKSK